MATLKIYNRQGAEVGEYQLDPSEFAPSINRQLLHDVVVMYQASQRQGTKKTKARRDVAGSTKKLYRQKGTGNARAGSRRSGTRRGGGHINHRVPQDWSYRLPRKAVRLACRMAFASKIIDDQVVVVDELSFSAPQTKEMAGVLKALGLTGKSTLVATAAYDPNVYKSARNIQDVSVAPAADLNALSVLGPEKVLVTRAALDALREKARAERGDRSAAAGAAS